MQVLSTIQAMVQAITENAGNAWKSIGPDLMTANIFTTKL